MHPLMLTIETATLSGSICVTRGSEMLGSYRGDPQISHSNTLLLDIDRLLSRTRIKLTEISLFAVAVGPGSFTGLRIGIATVKGLAETLNRPCVSIPTLPAIAHSAGPSEMTVSMLPAGRGEVFAQAFAVRPDGLVSELDQPVHLPPARLLDRYSAVSRILFVGEGAQIHREMILKKAAEFQHAWRVAEFENILAQNVAALALLKFANDQLEEAASVQALYVRPSDAELKHSPR